MTPAVVTILALGGLLFLALIFGVIAACILSSRISQKEEDRRRKWWHDHPGGK